MARIRWRTWKRAGLVPGQPGTVPTNPDRIEHQPAASRKTCAECFGPRNAYGQRPFCNRCLNDLFGWPGERTYDNFVRTQKRMTTMRANRRERHDQPG